MPRYGALESTNKFYDRFLKYVSVMVLLNVFICFSPFAGKIQESYVVKKKTERKFMSGCFKSQLNQMEVQTRLQITFKVFNYLTQILDSI